MKCLMMRVQRQDARHAVTVVTASSEVSSGCNNDNFVRGRLCSARTLLEMLSCLGIWSRVQCM